MQLTKHGLDAASVTITWPAERGPRSLTPISRILRTTGLITRNPINAPLLLSALRLIPIHECWQSDLAH